MTEKHTPGPYQLTADGTSIQDAAKTTTICKMNMNIPSGPANARLFIAAPKMLAELLDCPCPHPANAAPDNLTVQGCIDRGECGCSRGLAAQTAGVV